MALLAVIGALEDWPTEKTYLVHGGLDILPRLSMAMRLADYHRAPMHIRRKLKSIRKELQGSDGLIHRCNVIVHGVQKACDTNPSEIIFTMPRFSGAMRETSLSSVDLYALGKSIFEQGEIAWSVFDAIGTWKFGKHGKEDVASDNVGPVSPTEVKPSLAQRFYASIKKLWRNK